MRQSISRWSLAALVGAAVIACHGIAQAQFPDRLTPPADANRIPEALEKLIDEIDEEALARPPLREFKEDKGPAQQIKLFRADPKLLENKFLARIVLTMASPNVMPTRAPNVSTDLRANELGRAIHDLPQGAKRLIDGREKILIFSGIDPSNVRYSERPIRISDALPTLSGFFKFLSDLCPMEQLPPQDSMDFLTGADCDRDVAWQYAGRFAQDDDRREWYITVYAPTEDLSEQRARAILLLLDNGLCRPLQRDCFAEAKKSLEEARKGYEEVARQSADIAAKEESLARPSEITSDILTQLRAQKVMVAIELAGLNARIKACNEKLMAVRDDLRPPSQVHNSISDMKVRAEVELVGSKEKLDRINALIAEGNDRESLRGQLDQLRGARQALQQKIDRQHQRRAEAYARLVSLYAPLEIKDNKVTISPVEWTN